MQQRRPTKKPAGQIPSDTVLTVPAAYWDELKKRDLDRLCRLSQATLRPPRGLLLPFFNRSVRVYLDSSSLQEQVSGRWQPVESPLMELVILVYLLKVSEAPLTGEKVSVSDLRDAHFFQGPHTLKTASLLGIFGRDQAGFAAAMRF